MKTPLRAHKRELQVRSRRYRPEIPPESPWKDVIERSRDFLAEYSGPLSRRRVRELPELLPGRDLGLDVICGSIMGRGDFIHDPAA